jgi:3-oxoadipate enol-lactonase
MPWIDTGRTCLFYEDAGDGQLVTLLVHEMGGSSQSWHGVMHRFAASQRVIAIDLRCAGQSEKPRAPFELSDLADDVADLVRALSLSAVNVIGVALGAVVASILAMRHPDLVRRLVICSGTDVMADAAKEYNRTRATKVRGLGMRAVAEATLVNSFPKGFESLRDRYLPIFLSNDPYAYAETSLALARFNVGTEEFAKIRCPTLVMSGAHDFIWPPEVGHRLASLIPGATFLALSDGAHLPHLQCPVEFVENIEIFMGRPQT